MPTIHYWPQKNKPQPLSHLHRLSLDGVTLQQGANEVSTQDYARVLAHADTPQMVDGGALELDGAIAEPTPVDLPPVTLLPPIETRLAQLQEFVAAKAWRSLRDEATPHGIEKPGDGWDAAVLPILVAEYGQSAAEEVYTSPE
jgi:hypothetical protein